VDARFRERLGTYLLGVAIGLTLLGFLYMAKWQSAQRRQAGQGAPATTGTTAK
jgi:hypothetical protein